MVVRAGTLVVSPPLGERVAQGWRGEAEPYPKLGEGERARYSSTPLSRTTAVYSL